MSAVIEAPQAATKVSLIAKLANRYNVDPNKMLSTLKATAFKGDVTNEQMMALLIVADQHGLNPWTKEIYAFPDKNNGIVPVVGVDGWTRIINTRPEFDGLDFNDGPSGEKGMPEWIECVIYRKDRNHPIRAREYFAECRRNTGPWTSHPRRMLRHKALIQCARLAFGYTGIYDQDEAERIIEGDVQVVSSGAVDELNRRIDSRTAIGQSPAGEVIDADGVIKAAPERHLSGSGESPPNPPPEPQPEQIEVGLPAMTFAQVAEELKAARTTDEIDEAATLIESVADDSQKAELVELYHALRAEIAA
jgi:phage recombination protein Bet